MRACLSLLPASALLIAHTSDNILHFISEEVESFPLLEESFRNLPSRAPEHPTSTPASSLESLVDHGVVRYIEHPTSSIVETGQKAIKMYETNKQQEKTNLETGEHSIFPMKQLCADRISKMKLSSDGYLIFNDRKIPLITLLSYPFSTDGLFVTASKIHNTRIIRDTLVVTATFKVDIFDFLELARKTLSFSYLVYIYETVKEYEVNGCRLKVKDKEYVFRAPILALYECREQNGLNYMVRVFCNGRVNVKREHRMRGLEIPTSSTSMRWTLLLVFVVGIAFLTMFLGRGPTIKEAVAGGLWTGRFMGRECLVYQINDKRVERIMEIKALKNSPFIDILYVGRCFFKKVVFTEMSYQLSSSESGRMKEQMYRLCCMVEQLHESGFIHGRLCPENIRLTERGELKIQDFFENSGWRPSSQILNSTKPGTKEGDMFLLGCVFHFLLSGYHPFDRIPFHKPDRPTSIKYSERMNLKSIIEDKPKLTDNVIYNRVLEGEKKREVENNIVAKSYNIKIAGQIEHDLIYTAIFKNISKLSNHPYFWPIQRRTELICDFSDLLEANPALKPRFERHSKRIFSDSWFDYLEPVILVNVTAKRRYDGTKLTDLVRLIRNTQRHFHELMYKELFDEYDGGLGGYYMEIFPELFMSVYNMREIRSDKHFLKYFE